MQRIDMLLAARRPHWLTAMVVSLTIVGVLSALWSIPAPEAFRDISPLLNWASAALLALVVYYFVLSLPLALALLPIIIMLGGICALLDKIPGALWPIPLGLLIAASILDVLTLKKRALGEHLQLYQLALLTPLWLFHQSVRR